MFAPLLVDPLNMTMGSSASAPPAAATHSRLWLLAVLALVLLRALPNIRYPIGRDQATFCVIGQGLLHGQQLYRDLWDIKSPGIFYIFALFVKIFGQVMWLVGLVDILWLLIISCCIFRFAERYLGKAAAVIAVVVNANWHCRAGYINAGQPETFLMLFVFAGCFLVPQGARWRSLRQYVAGLLFGAAFWLKYNALAFLPLLLIVPYVDWGRLDAEPPHLSLLIPWRLRRRRTWLLLSGLLTMVGFVLGYFVLAGLWGPLWESHFEIVPRYAGMGFARRPDYWVVPIAATMRQLGLASVAATLVGFLIAHKKHELSCYGPVFLGAAMGYASTAMQVRFHWYTFETCYPFFAMVWGYLGVKVDEGVQAASVRFVSSFRRWARVVAGVLLASIIFWPLPDQVRGLVEDYQGLGAWWCDQDRFYANYPSQFNLEHLKDQMQVIHYLQKRSAPGDGLFVWGTHPLLYFLTGLHSPTRFVPNHPLISPWGPPAWREELMSSLEKSPPSFIVVARRDALPSVTFSRLDSEQLLKSFPELNAFISESYQAVATFPYFVIYRRNALPFNGPNTGLTGSDQNMPNLVLLGKQQELAQEVF